jgi:hypothetical protein
VEVIDEDKNPFCRSVDHSRALDTKRVGFGRGENEHHRDESSDSYRYPQNH